MNSMNENCLIERYVQIAETIRAACIKAALAGYEDAGMHGLCHEGAWECAIDAMRALDVKVLLAQWTEEKSSVEPQQ